MKEAGNTWGNAELHLRGGETKTAAYDLATNRMTFEIADFVKAVEAGDRERFLGWQKESLMVMELLDRLRS